jgi:hypothetical protein
MSYLPDDELRDPNKPKPPSMGRVAVWLFVGGVAVYLIVSGIIGSLS